MIDWKVYSEMGEEEQAAMLVGQKVYISKVEFKYNEDQTEIESVMFYEAPPGEEKNSFELEFFNRDDPVPIHSPYEIGFVTRGGENSES